VTGRWTSVGYSAEKTMPSMESLMALVGEPVDAPGVQALIASERLLSSTDEDLEEGVPVRSHLLSPSGGFEFSHTLGRLNTLFIYVRPKGGNAAFRGALMHGLTARSTRTDVRKRLGTPSRSGEAQTLPPLGRFGAYDRYDSKGLCLHFQYTEPEEQIELITVMAADTAP
jgi:hypothetical protein